MSTVVFPWPPKELSPNARLHWSALARAKKAYRRACWALALEAGLPLQFNPQPPGVNVHLVFCPPDRRARDEDNLVACMKAGLDGLADALKINDRAFKVTFEVSPEIGGMVRVSLSPREAA